MSWLQLSTADLAKLVAAIGGTDPAVMNKYERVPTSVPEPALPTVCAAAGAARKLALAKGKDVPDARRDKS